MIYKAERHYKSIVVSIHSDQEKGIGLDVENFAKRLGIEFTWSSVYTPAQNGRAERIGGVLSEKARCIRIAANLPEDLWPECYLAANYLLCRTPTKSLGWDSPIVSLQKQIGTEIKYELAHLKRYGCKAYVLLKGPEKPPKRNKLAPRAFIGYLVSYDSTNIYRIWDPVAYDVKGYRDVIFDETQIYDPSENQQQLQDRDLIDESVTVRVLKPAPYYSPLLDAEMDWLTTRPSQRNGDDLPKLDSSDDFTPGLPTPSQTASPSPYRTPEPTLSESPPLSRSPPPPESPPPPPSPLPRRRPGRPKKSNYSIEDLPETGNTPLNAVQPAQRD